jgi:colanic acid biosynthesis protein WcaH
VCDPRSAYPRRPVSGAPPNEQASAATGGTEDPFRVVVRHAPLVSIDLVVTRADGTVLLGLRTNEPARGTWFVPGARIRKDERIADAFTRVAAAELGATLAIGDAAFLGVYEHLYPTNYAGMPGVGTHYVVLAYRVAWPAGAAPVADAQHGELKWWPVADLRAAPEVHPNVKAYFPASA